MKKRLAIQAVAFGSIAFMCTSCMTSHQQPRDNMSGIVQNMMMEPASSDAEDTPPPRKKTIFSWLGGQRAQKRSSGKSQSGHPASTLAQQDDVLSSPSVPGEQGGVPGQSGSEPDGTGSTMSADPFTSTFIDRVAAIHPGDQFTVLFFRKPPQEGRTYRVGCLDRLSISIESQKPLVQEVVVRMDGRISFFLTDDLYVKGLTILQVRELIKACLATVTPSAEVTVFLAEGNAIAEDFLRRSNALEQNAFTVTTVRYDGMLTLPLIGDIHVAGLPLDDIRNAAQKRYDELLNEGVSIHLNLITQRGNTAILGEVGRPGLYPLYESQHPLFGLAMAGGKRETANLKKVVILKRQPDGTLARHFVNLKDGKAISRSHVMLDPEDILIVPMTGIANVNQWVDQYIRRLLPLPTSAGVSANYSID